MLCHVTHQIAGICLLSSGSSLVDDVCLHKHSSSLYVLSGFCFVGFFPLFNYISLIVSSNLSICWLLLFNIIAN